MTLDSFETKIPTQVVEQSTISGAYTIIDDDEKGPIDLQDLNSAEVDAITTDAPKAMVKDNCGKILFYLVEGIDYFISDSEKERVCVMRTSLIGMLVTLALMGSINLFILINCFYSKYCRHFQGPTSTVSTLTSTNSFQSKSTDSSKSY